jgi:thiol:disulfide interchange protein
MNRRSLLAILVAGIAGIFITRGSLAADHAFPDGSPKFETNYKAALASAAKDGKPVIVVFSASWCPPCQANKKKVYPSDAVKAYHDKFVWAYLDTDEEANAQVAKEFKVSGIPHIQFLSKAGKSLGTSIGGTTPDAFAGKLKEILAAAK